MSESADRMITEQMRFGTTTARHRLGPSARGNWRLARYAVALVVPLVAFALNRALSPFLEPAPLFMFLAAVFVVAWLTGAGPSVLATGICSLLGGWVVHGAASLQDRLVLIGLFLVAAAVIVGLTSHMQRLEREALIVNRIREEFLATASHELKGPLAALQLKLDSIEREASRALLPAESSARIAQRARAASGILTRLVRLIDLLLDMSRIEAGKLELERSEVDLAEVVSEVVARVREEAHRPCTLEVQGAAPIIGKWDKARLDQVVTNLVSNACKYGAGEPIEVEIAKDERVARIVVRDHGPGIPPRDQTVIFERFERGRGDKKVDGAGLGLWITRQIVEAHGGRVWVESSVGRGATFVVELPA